MDRLVTVALIGTARQDNLDTSTGTAIDALVAGLGQQGEVERKLLLTAGAWDVYRQAGRVAEYLSTLPEPARPETLRVCSPAVARLVQDMLTGVHGELLPEALERMQRTGLRLPPELLPMALDARSVEIRTLLAAALGERGRWLSQFNPAWSWVNETLLEEGNALPAEAETLWQEGTQGQRREILRRLRGIDPAQAREWLAAVWQQEKAEARAQFLEILEVGLSAADEAFLESALDDRSVNIRAAAAVLLARITTSALSIRMRERANEMLSYAKGKLTVAPPLSIDKQWQRDGIVAKPPRGVGERGWWLLQVLDRVPPSYWEARFQASPAQLIKAVSSHDWDQTVIEGWSQAAIRSNDEQWIVPLWDWWQQHYDACPDQLRKDLISRMPQHEAENRVHRQLINYKSLESAGWETLLSALPTPWSKDFGDTYLAEVRTYLDKIADDAQISYPWLTSITVATTSLPPACFAAAVETWRLPESNRASARWHVQRWHEQINTFTEAIRIRQRLMEEIK